MAQTFLPLARRSATTESMPFFSMVRRPRVETRRLTQRRSPSSQKRWVCRFGRKRRRFLLLAWETRLPTATLLPVTSQTRLIKFAKNQCVNDQTAGSRPSKAPPLYQPPSGRATTTFQSRGSSAIRPLFAARGAIPCPDGFAELCALQTGDTLPQRGVSHVSDNNRG